MAIENWIDEIPKLLGEIEGHNGQKIRAYRLIERREVPDELSEFPCALTIPQSADMNYNAGFSDDFYTGIVEVHICPDLLNSRLPDIIPYFKKIRNAFALHATLGGKVQYCILDEPKSIEGPFVMKYGEKDQPHWGLMVHWKAKENVSTDVVVAG